MDGAQQNMYRQIPSGKNTPNDPQAQKRLWDEKALNLNSFYGPNKTAESLRTGGGSFSDEKLSEFEEQTLSAFGMSAVNGLECASFGLPGKFTTPATPSPLSEEEAYLIEETLIESPTELTVDSIVSNIAAASDALPSIAPTTSGQQKVTKDAIYKMMAGDLQSQRQRDVQLSSALMQMGKGSEILGNAISKLADKL